MAGVSFSLGVREEMSRLFPEKKCCREAMLASFIFSGKSLKRAVVFKNGSKDPNYEKSGSANGSKDSNYKYEEDQAVPVVSTGFPRTARLVFRLAKDIFGGGVKWKSSREKFLGKRNVYHIFSPYSKEMRDYSCRWGNRNEA